MKNRSYFIGAAVFDACLTGAIFAQAGEPAAVSLSGDWKVTVSVPGTPPLSSTLDVIPAEITTVVAEKYNKLPDFKPDTNLNWAGWTKGAKLKGVTAAECSVKCALEPDSVVIRDGVEATSMTFEKGKDYDADLDWGAIGRLPEGRIKADQPVFISYQYGKMRIDTIVLAADGTITLKQGTPRIAVPSAPALDKGETRLANIFIPGRLAALTAENLFPILETAYPEPPKPVPSIAEAHLPKTMKKLLAGEPLKILAWGDSVTAMMIWQKIFIERLQAKYPKARIELVTEAWGGRSTSLYLAEPPGSVHNYKEKVLDQKPDLIISEFVNDAYGNEQWVEERYGKLLVDFKEIGAEWIILTPHYTWGFKSQRDIDDDPRPYVKGLRLFAEKHQVVLGDASLRWGRLWRQGIPYLTLMNNNFNHPTAPGHALFADSLMALFP